MDAQGKTFNKLKQCTLDEMLEHLNELKRPAPQYHTDGTVWGYRDYYPDIVFHLERVKCIELHGWTVEDFYNELEKRSITKMVEEYNNSIKFPDDLLQRARRLFPNIRFVEAKIYFE